MSRKLTTLEFIGKAKLIHGNKYDYSLTEYTLSKNKVKIICPIHGVFEKFASGHLSGNGCNKCANSRLVPISKFIKRAKLVHGNRYDYSNAVCCGSKTKVEIICKKHGSFWQLQNYHLKGGNCKECSLYNRKPRISQHDFINRVKKIHGDKYIYDKTIYKSSREKVIITCRKHGDFLQTAGSHYKNGCPKCAGRYKEEYKKNNIAVFEVFNKDFKLVGINCRRNTEDENILEVQCHLCKKWFIPTYRASQNKKGSINGTAKDYGDRNLYCSEECKVLCPTFAFRTDNVDPRSKLYIEKTESEEVRSCQTNIIKQLQCQSDGKLYCERCGNEIHNIDAELHHTYEIHKHGMAASDHETQMLVCVKCHLELHNNCK